MADKSKRVEQFIADPKKAVWTLALPILLGMGVQYIYSLTDTFFVSRIGSDAIAAMQFNMPFVFFAISICFGLGIGVTSVIARALGANDKDTAENAAEHSVIMGIILGLVISILCIVFRYPIFKFLGAPENIIPLGIQYFEVIVYGFVFNILSVFFRAILTGEGDTTAPVKILVAGTILNIILDPIYIFVLDMGIAGAAWATITAQFFVMVLYIIFFFVQKKSYLSFEFRCFKYSPKLLKDIFNVGLPASLSFVIMSFGQMLYNRIVVFFGSDAVAAIGVGMRLDQVFFMPLLAIASSMVTLIGMFRGAKRLDLIKSTYYYVIGRGQIIAIVLGLLFYILSPYFMKMFVTDPELIRIGVQYIHYTVFGYPLVVFGMTAGRSFQGIGKGTPGLVITTIRIIGIIVPLSLLFTRVLGYGIQSVFVSQVISSLGAALLGHFWFLKDVDHLIKEEAQYE